MPSTFTQAMLTMSAAADSPTDYVAQWKRTTGRKALGVFPMNFPSELAHAAGVLPVIIQEDREPITVGRNLLGEFNCGYTRNVADQAALGRLDVYDGFFHADHCIQLLGAIDVVREDESDKPVYFGQLMSSMSDDWAFPQVLGKMEDFRSELEKFAGRPISTADLARSIDIFDTNRRLMRTIFENRRSGDAALTSAQLQVLVKSSMIMDKEEHSELLRQVTASLNFVPRNDRIRVHLSGHFCHAPKPELLELIEDCGAIVVDDDLFHGTRYVSTDIGDTGHPLEALASVYLRRNTAIPCPTRVQHEADWDRFLVDSVYASGAQGVIVLMAKFCEPHMLFYPELRKALEAKSIPLLLIETEHEGLPMESIRTRVEALVERIRRKQLSTV
ncbi:benzoyl-CoA reductase, subunit C [Rhodococcus opacus PD630]|uniref:2-hydroxyacyl-CoA dehydratase subunit D n=1 Tax=Rhodococcus opacus TaxID=37919 RepID=UPI00029CAD32|nr:2-hydroxyacyl-CoA dehydratase family protein [Rhodococcus opacus]AHK34106.1 Benzoyl-CoA reductase subunit C [Rhodococcus opacus PD630]EHI39975.1 benzoyl-CoA reductase, subunit C [Rhodococcus opacus PD630]UDG96307.1 2-hydroxyacyl-CoA dehydratase family protein [Rhodococcus opacus PD630]